MSNSEPFSPEMVNFLLAAEADKAASQLSAEEISPAATIATISKLRDQFSPQQAGAVLSHARLRNRAVAKFPEAKRMYFSAESLEQATSWTVALHRAEQIHARAPEGPILDLGCGIGGDTLALAQYRQVIAYEQVPVRMTLARANAQALGLADAIVFRCEDWTAELAAGTLPMAAAAFVDPSRRVDGRRVFSLHEIQPPLETLLRLQNHIGNVAVKVMPGVDDDELPAGAGVEFVSHEGVCKEAVLWFGDLAHQPRWASVHDGTAWHKLIAEGFPAPVGAITPGMLLYEPDPAVIRAGSFHELCMILDAHLIDPRIAYAVSYVYRPTAYAAAFCIDEVHPFNLKLLNKRLRELDVGRVELKKRGAPFEPESLRSRLKLVPGGGAAVVFFTRIGDAPKMIIGQRIQPK